MPEVKNLGMKDLGQDFQRLNDARPGTIEVLIAVGKEHLVVPDGPERVH